MAQIAPSAVLRKAYPRGWGSGKSAGISRKNIRGVNFMKKSKVNFHENVASKQRKNVQNTQCVFENSTNFFELLPLGQEV